ncbi:MAG: hypothetical protein ACQESG_05800 [Nanobdellota archaeon]
MPKVFDQTTNKILGQIEKIPTLKGVGLQRFKGNDPYFQNHYVYTDDPNKASLYFDDRTIKLILEMEQRFGGISIQIEENMIAVYTNYINMLYFGSKYNINNNKMIGLPGDYKLEFNELEKIKENLDYFIGASKNLINHFSNY